MTNLIFRAIVKKLTVIKEVQSYLAEKFPDPEDCEMLGMCDEFLDIDAEQLNILCLAII
jgi:hypothetical protein